MRTSKGNPQVLDNCIRYETKGGSAVFLAPEVNLFTLQGNVQAYKEHFKTIYNDMYLQC